MKSLKVGAVVLNQTPLDWDGNEMRIVAALAAAREDEVGLVCLPEMCITGYGCEDAFNGVDVVRQSERVLLELLPETRGLVACFGLPWLHHRGLFNAVAVAANGRLIGIVPKQHLAGDGIHYEPRWFKAWRKDVVTETRVGDQVVPLGDLLFELGGVRFGFEICEDAWVAERPGARLASYGLDVLLNPSASHFAFGKLEVRRRFVTEGSRAFGAAYVYSNLLGNEAGRAIYDGGSLIATGGDIIAQGPRLTLRDFELTSAVVDLAAARLARARTASFSPALTEHPGLVAGDHLWPVAGAPTTRIAPGAPWEESPYVKEEEFARAEALALFDYLRKSRSQGFTVSLSGGCDSSVVVTLVHLMVRRALEDLGVEGLRSRLRFLEPALTESTEQEITRRLLTTAYQGTANSSQVTRDAARAVAEACGAKHFELDVEPFVQSYTSAIAAALGRKVSWETDDLALQNVQARVRAPGIWLVANLENKLLLATSNRSEAAVGYATMDGDTCGGLSPLAGVDKAFLRQWLSWLETHGPSGLGPIPAVRAVTQQRSTPELRPAAAGQKSEDDLMPFPVLDRIERLAIRDKLAPTDVLDRLAADYPEVERERLSGWIERFFTLFCRNQWKRERLAPAFHLDDENLDPKTWCRFPILSGGYRRELREMRGER
ncbi:MAG: NAD(+) synthase [Candidatus Eisenbacteria bacterium]|nr:NAD(+) synthase [Candidatus Eisenbacteria bacterium]